jgi:hypothetical protein
MSYRPEGKKVWFGNSGGIYAARPDATPLPEGEAYTDAELALMDAAVAELTRDRDKWQTRSEVDSAESERLKAVVEAKYKELERAIEVSDNRLKRALAAEQRIRELEGRDKAVSVLLDYLFRAASGEEHSSGYCESQECGGCDENDLPCDGWFSAAQRTIVVRYKQVRADALEEAAKWHDKEAAKLGGHGGQEETVALVHLASADEIRARKEK